MSEVSIVEEVVAGPVQLVETVVTGPAQLVREVVYLGPPGGGGSIETVASGATFRVLFDGEWPVRPTAREDVMVLWVGPDPSPEIVEPPSVAGMYAGDARIVT